MDVEYGEGLDLRFFIDLPAKEYSVVVLRVHSGILGEGEEKAEGSWLFTNEPCQTGFKYTDQRLTRKVAAASIDEEHQPVFAIGSRFVTETMQGTFPGTVVIAMGCRSFIDNDLAEAFIAKGASLYIGWSGLVTLDYTDEITQVLVDKLFRQGMIVQEAIDTTLAEIGTQASHEATLRYYPSESGGKSITDLLRKN